MPIPLPPHQTALLSRLVRVHDAARGRVLLGSIAVSKCAVGSRFGRHWRVFAIGFELMSIDETAQLHEMSIEPMRPRCPPRSPV